MSTRIATGQAFLGAARRTLETRGDRPAFTFLEDGEMERAETLSFAELDRAARYIAADLQATGVRPGDRVILLQEPGPHMVTGFLGAIYAGAIAVPCYPPSPFRGARGTERLGIVVEDASAAAALTTTARAPALELLKEKYPELLWILTDTVSSCSDAYATVDVDPHDLAFLQYTSGSTSDPRGVRVTHGSLAANIGMMVEAFGLGEDSIVCSWLPPFHDMGLIATILMPLAIGCRTVQMAPEAFLRRPDRWLRAITNFRGTFTAAPNFAYELCVRRVFDLEGLDLKSWTVAVNGAEPIKEHTLAEFTRKFAECGLQPSTLWPGYGLAEATLMVSTRSRGPGSTLWIDPDQLSEGRLVLTDPELGRPLVSCGWPPPGTTVTVCDPVTGEPVDDGIIGEIRVSGPHVCDGYWGNPAMSAEIFPDGILRTGDLGALWQGAVYVTGRLKDVLIVRGRNHYPQDIEQTMETVDPNLRPGCGVAVSVPSDTGELLVLIQEVEKDGYADAERIVDKIRRRVSEQHGVSADAVVLVRRSSVPKTTSGKLRRSSAAEAFRTGGLRVVHKWMATARKQPAVSAGAHRPAGAADPKPHAELRLELDRPQVRVGMGLANSAQAVVGRVLEEAGFLMRPEGSLFVVLHRPADREPSGLLTVCGSLFAEQHTDFRREVRLARMLASAGVAVARFHYRSVGNSDAGTASLDAFSRDALDVTLAAARSASLSRVAFLGVGIGSLIASRALSTHPNAPLLLWKPVLDGTKFFRDFFRARWVAATRIGGSRPVATEELLARLTRQGQIDVMGFTVAASLYKSLNESHLAQTVPQHPRSILVQPFRGNRAAGLEQLVADWRRSGCRVDLEPVALAEDPWFIPDGAEVAASITAAEDRLMASVRDWLVGVWSEGE